MPEELVHWRSKDHELDFVLAPDAFVEVKHGRTSLAEFSWFRQVFPKAHLTVITTGKFERDWIKSMTIDEFLLEC
jgi:hypothetical protein